MTYIDSRALDRELKKGSAELLILSLLEAQPRHETFGTVIVFEDLYGNKWDLIERKD